MSTTSNLIVPDKARGESPLQPVTEASAMLAMIASASRDSAVDPAKMRELWAFRKEVLAEQSATAFNAAMSQAQAEMTPIATDMQNKQTSSRYASYAALDRVVRPIYTKHGFALSFDEADSPKPDHVRVLCYVSHGGGFSKTFHTDMPADGKGAKGGDVMTKTHAVGAAKSYGMRYLLRSIFNLAVGEEDKDGNDAALITAKQVADLECLISETKTDKVRFLKYIKADSLQNIRASSFQTCVAALESKRRHA
jgi:hypothetical protein